MAHKVNLGDIQVTNEYECFKLKANPFPITAISVGGTPFPLYAPQANERIRDYIIRTYRQGEYSGMLIIGDYGFGKTYTLRWIDKEINETFSQRNSEAACAIYVESPRSTPRELILSMISYYGTGKYLTMLWKLVTIAFRKEYEKEGNKFLDNFRPRLLGLFDRDSLLEMLDEAKIMDPIRFLKHICDMRKRNQFDLEKFSRFAYENVIAPIFGHTDFATQLAKLNEKGDFDVSYRKWFSLLEFKAASKKMYVGPSDHEFMRSILKVFKESGYRRIYLLVDEFENLYEGLEKKKMESYLESLRHWIDFNQDMLCLILAMKPAVQQAVERVHPGLPDRFPSRYWIDLGGITMEALENFVGGFLRKERKKGFEHMGIDPFTKDGLAEIYGYTGLNPRLILQSCSELLYQAVKAGGKPVDSRFVKSHYATSEPSIWTGRRKVWTRKRTKEKIQEESGGE